MDLKTEIRTIALCLYRSDSWQGLPWGPKRLLSRHIADVIEAEAKAANERCAREKAETERRMRETPKAKRENPVPWEP